MVSKVLLINGTEVTLRIKHIMCHMTKQNRIVWKLRVEFPKDLYQAHYLLS